MATIEVELPAGITSADVTGHGDYGDVGQYAVSVCAAELLPGLIHWPDRRVHPSEFPAPPYELGLLPPDFGPAPPRPIHCDRFAVALPYAGLAILHPDDAGLDLAQELLLRWGGMGFGRHGTRSQLGQKVAEILCAILPEIKAQAFYRVLEFGEEVRKRLGLESSFLNPYGDSRNSKPAPVATTQPASTCAP